MDAHRLQPNDQMINEELNLLEKYVLKRAFLLFDYDIKEEIKSSSLVMI